MSEIPYMLEDTREEFERVRDLAWPAPALTAEEAARVAVFDAAEEPEEVTVERVARELYRQWREDSGGDPADLPDWERLNEECGDEDESDLRGAYRRRAVLILTALRGDRAPLAGQHTTDEPCSAPSYGADTPCVLPDDHAGGCHR